MQLMGNYLYKKDDNRSLTDQINELTEEAFEDGKAYKLI